MLKTTYSKNQSTCERCFNQTVVIGVHSHTLAKFVTFCDHCKFTKCQQLYPWQQTQNISFAVAQRYETLYQEYMRHERVQDMLHTGMLTVVIMLIIIALVQISYDRHLFGLP